MAKYANNMKKLFLKNGRYVWVTIDSDGSQLRSISVYKQKDRADAYFYRIVYGNVIRPKMVVQLGEDTDELEFKDITEAAEIIENFDQYFNNLNQ